SARGTDVRHRAQPPPQLSPSFARVPGSADALNGAFVNLELIRQGQARSYRRYPCRFTAEMNGWEAYARAHRKGLWRD
ncbi:MAG: thermonuclease family protein, partial [Actinobacteria bacterium]|nr:thermonuclease family protein [Actinomycetota bacterium]